MAARLSIDADIRRARMPPAAAYLSPDVWQRYVEHVLTRSWHVVSTTAGLEEPGSARAVTLLPGALDERLVLVRDLAGELRALSNVCTHRGHPVVEGEWCLETLRCRYHGRRFHLDGTFAYMPGMERAEGFPTDEDSLRRAPLADWRGILFASVQGGGRWAEAVAPVDRLLEGLGLLEWSHARERDFEIEVEAHAWLWCENALEGMHAPGVHEAIAARRDAPEPRFLLWDHGSVRVREAADDDADLFAPPPGHPDHGRRVAAYHVFLFPTTFLNLYPWGALLHSVLPIGPSRSRVAFRFFAAAGTSVRDAHVRRVRAMAAEDAAVLREVQSSLPSRLRRAAGRYVPGHEDAVHHFHRLLARALG